MEQRTFETSLGQIILSGDFRGDRPFVVMFRGAYASEGQFTTLASLLPTARVLIGDIPGWRSPFLREQSLDAYTEAWSEVIAKLASPTAVCGASISGVACFGINAPNLIGVVVLDPPMTSIDLEPLKIRLAHRIANPPNQRECELQWNLFGWAADRLEERDYFPLLDQIKAPVLVLVGDSGAHGELPSLVGPESLARLVADPRVSVGRVRGGGHHIHHSAFAQALRSLLERSDQRNHQPP